MSTHTSCCPPLPILTSRPWLAMALDEARTRLRAWRQARQDRARRRAEWQVLQQLSDATLRDIGLSDRQIEPRMTLGVLDHERGRWS